ncbi:hypothetical protein HY734_02905 [Candidatus Uhrbacteria bacterium]|nr:hypothetical protein [Candidatus Uhrbacteria bacterium]
MNKTHDLSQDVLSRIRTESLRPIPKWRFVFRNVLLWGLGGFIVLTGGVAFAVILHIVQNNDWDLYRAMGQSLPAFVVLTLPYLWVVVFVSMITLAHVHVRHTKGGYRYRLPVLLGVVLAASLALGGMFARAGIGQAFDEAASGRFPVYRALVSHRETRWLRPTEGFLSGTVTSINPEAMRFALEDPQGNAWEVSYDRNTRRHPPFFEIRPSVRVRIVGQARNQGRFHAEQVAPWFLRDRPIPAFLRDLVGQGKKDPR